MKQSAELLRRRTSSDAESALGVIAQALTISSYCEKLLEMKADALLTVRAFISCGFENLSSSKERKKTNQNILVFSDPFLPYGQHFRDY